MRPTWLVAKYIDDLRRREPINVGILLFADNAVLQRFVGQREDGSIDGRAARVTGPRLDNYKAWVRYWSQMASLPGARPEGLLDDGLGDSSYFLEFGGDQVLGADDPQSLLAQLYEILVEPPRATRDPGVKQATEAMFGRLEIADRVVADPTLKWSEDGVLDVLRFDFRFDNGRPHLIHTVTTFGDRRDWDAVHEAAYNFQTLGKTDVGQAGGTGLAVVVDAAQSRDAVRLLQRHVRVIDLASPDADMMARELLGV